MDFATPTSLFQQLLYLLWGPRPTSQCWQTGVLQQALKCMVYGFNNVRGNFQLIPWTVGTLRIQRPDQNGTTRNREVVIIWWIWVMWKAKPNYFSQGKNDFFFFFTWISSFSKILLGSSFPFLLLHQVFPRNQHTVGKIQRQELRGEMTTVYSWDIIWGALVLFLYV